MKQVVSALDGLIDQPPLNFNNQTEVILKLTQFNDFLNRKNLPTMAAMSDLIANRLKNDQYDIHPEVGVLLLLMADTIEVLLSPEKFK